ncbi:MAG: hypothetical protein BroJett018_27220 [Chloroflexota bacterium]|nr:MAG: hypothetical protein BroJett018_27220 [Chloroflexota bacterium]
MFHFENPGHRSALQKLGVLHTEEQQVGGAELAQRLIAVTQVEATLYVLKQEMSHHLMNYRLGESLIEMAHEAAEQIEDQASLAIAIDRQQQLLATVRRVNEQTQAMLLFAAEFSQHTLEVTATARQYVVDIVRMAVEAQKLGLEQAEWIQSKIQGIQDIITEQKSKLGG